MILAICAKVTSSYIVGSNNSINSLWLYHLWVSNSLMITMLSSLSSSSRVLMLKMASAMDTKVLRT